jgi:hypothetical protein
MWAGSTHVNARLRAYAFTPHSGSSVGSSGWASVGSAEEVVVAAVVVVVVDVGSVGWSAVGSAAVTSGPTYAATAAAAVTAD